MTPPTWPNLIPQSQISEPESPGGVRVRQELREPPHRLGARSATSASSSRTSRCSPTSRTRRRSTSRGSSTGTTRCSARRGARASAPTAPTASASLTASRARPSRKYDGAHHRHEQEVRAELAVPVELHAVEGPVRRRQRARPVHVPLRGRRTTSRPSTTTRTATSATASTRGCSRRPKGFEFNTRVSSRSAQPKSVGNTPQDRIQPDGTIIKRNTLRKDNEFFTWDLRVSAADQGRPGLTIEPIFEVFNLTNSKNIRRPGGDEPDLQLRRHGAERARRSAPGAARGARAVLADGARRAGRGPRRDAPVRARPDTAEGVRLYVASRCCT